VNEDQPRDPDGRFASAGGAAGLKAWAGARTPSPAGFRATDGKDMHDAISKAAEGEHGLFLTVYSPAEYSQMKCYTSADGKVGGALKDHGDGRIEAVSLFNNGGPRGSGMAMLDHLISRGANYLECFKGHLDRLYATKGFETTSTMKFDDRYAPKGWDFGRHGRPDLVSMSLKKAKAS
jgi:hypothetical protein